MRNFLIKNNLKTMKTKLLFVCILFSACFGKCVQGFLKNIDLQILCWKLGNVNSLMRKGVIIEKIIGMPCLINYSHKVMYDGL